MFGKSTPFHLLIPLSLLVQACERKSSLDEAAIRQWAASPEVVSRNIPSAYSHMESEGRYLAVAAGNFKETPEGIDLENSTPLMDGFYVFPGKIRVASIDEAIQTMRRIEPGTFTFEVAPSVGEEPSN